MNACVFLTVITPDVTSLNTLDLQHGHPSAFEDGKALQKLT